MGRDIRKQVLIQVKSISTHTPAWGATLTAAKGKIDELISTHTPAWGATRVYRKGSVEVKHFNSHARVGRDQVTYQSIALR